MSAIDKGFETEHDCGIGSAVGRQKMMRPVELEAASTADSTAASESKGRESEGMEQTPDKGELGGPSTGCHPPFSAEAGIEATAVPSSPFPRQAVQGEQKTSNRRGKASTGHRLSEARYGSTTAARAARKIYRSRRVRASRIIRRRTSSASLSNGVRDTGLGRGTPSGTADPADEPACCKQRQAQQSRRGPLSQQLSCSDRERRSTYYSICLNASPDELTVVSYNVRLEGGGGVFDDNWRRREARLLSYIHSLDDVHHPDVLLLQGAHAHSTLRLLKRLAREEPLFPFQTRVVGSDMGCCKRDNADGGCSCCGSSWCGLSLSTSRVGAKKGTSAAFVTNNGWDSVCGSYSRFKGNGGIVILSKWPFLRRHAYILSTSAFPQSLSNVGAVLVQLEKCGKVYNVLAMQLQPGDSAHNALRVKQAKEVMAWVRTGMEDSEKVEFSSCDMDGSASPPAEGSTYADGGSVPGRENESGCPYTPYGKEIHGGYPGNELRGPDFSAKGPNGRRRRSALPRGILKVTDPLVIGGNLNFRYYEDNVCLAEALGPEGLNATLALEDASVAQPTFDTVNNDTCFLSRGRPKEPEQELLDYLLIYTDHAGRVARGQRTLVEAASEKIAQHITVLGCLPCGTVDVSHVSDHFPICATFAHTGLS